MSKREADEITGVETTGHEWDGIRELDNPLPRWWLWVFYGCIAVAAVYWVLMPAWPGIHGYTKGILGASDRVEVSRQLAELQTLRGAEGAKLKSVSLEQIEADPQLQAYALAVGQSVFGDNCATCHGTGGTGGKGYPNLRDDVWLWGGTLEDIRHTIEGRAAPIFAEQCAACHGPEGKGDQTKGAPNLTDADWLYGPNREDIRGQIWNGRGGVMPTWGARFDPQTIKALAVYIHANAAGQ